MTRADDQVVLAEAISYSIDEARQTLAGYCLALKAFRWSPPRRSRSFGERPREEYVPRWAYSTYDDLPANRHRPEVREIDILVAAGLNARIGSKEFAALRAVCSEAFDALAMVPLDVTFWNLPRSEVKHPPQGSDAWWLTRAWWLLEGARDVGPARAYKVLHHKRPLLVPLLDNETLRPIKAAAEAAGHGNTWVQIHDDLTHQKLLFGELESWFNSLPGHRLPLHRLRIHDVLLWCHVAGERNDAARAGRDDVLPILNGVREGVVVGFPALDAVPE